MARIRTVKPSFWEDELVGTLTPRARLLFIASWNFADDEGLLRWTADYLRVSVFMHDSMSERQVANLMKELTDAGLVVPYKGGKTQLRLGWIPGFPKHQRINRPQPSKLPPPSLQSKEIAIAYGRRDGWRCGICEGSITAPVDDGYWPKGNDIAQHLSLDHVLPRSMGGSDYPSNIQIAHRKCNCGKREQVDESLIPADVNRSVPSSQNDSVNHSPPEGKGREGKGITDSVSTDQLQSEPLPGVVETEPEFERRSSLCGKVLASLDPGAKPPPATQVLNLVNWTLSHLDWLVVEEAVAYAATLDQRPRSLKYLAKMLRQWGAERGVDMPEWTP